MQPPLRTVPPWRRATVGNRKAAALRARERRSLSPARLPWPQRDLNPCYRLESSDQRVFRRFSTLRKVVRFSSPEVLFGPFSVLDVIRPFSLSRVQNVSRQEPVRRFESWAGHLDPLIRTRA